VKAISYSIVASPKLQLCGPKLAVTHIHTLQLKLKTPHDFSIESQQMTRKVGFLGFFLSSTFFQLVVRYKKLTGPAICSIMECK
jgi:hypothetical protein